MRDCRNSTDCFLVKPSCARTIEAYKPIKDCIYEEAHTLLEGYCTLIHSSSCVCKQCFRDKAVEMELAIATVRCSNPDCPWEGQCNNYQVREIDCTYAQVASTCSNLVLHVDRLWTRPHQQAIGQGESEIWHSSVQPAVF